MDDIKARLQETSENCFKCYESWSGNKKDRKAREDLQEAIHELRKVSSRLEIELAVSERNEMSQKPIPIPSHRDSKRRIPSQSENDDNAGNKGNDENDSSNAGVKAGLHPRRSAGRKTTGTIRSGGSGGNSDVDND